MLPRARALDRPEVRPSTGPGRGGSTFLHAVSALGPEALLGPEAPPERRRNSQGGLVGVAPIPSRLLSWPRVTWQLHGVPGAGWLDVGHQGRAAGGPGRGYAGVSETLTRESLPSIPVGSINVPHKSGNLISIVSSEEKVTSTPGD